MFYAWCNFTFYYSNHINNQVKYWWNIPVELLKTNQKQKNVLVRYGGQQDASTSKVSLVSQPSMCHNNPQNSHTVNSKSTLEKSTQDNSEKVNAARSSVNLLTSVLVPICMAFQNLSLHQFSTYLDHVLTKVNAGQTCVETLAAVNSSFFPRVNQNCFQGARTKSKEEMMCEDEMSEKVLQCWLYLYQSLRCVTHLLGV